MATLQDQLKKYSQAELEQFLNQLLQNPVYKEWKCLADMRIHGLETGAVNHVIITEEDKANHNKNIGLRQGLGDFANAILTAQTLIQKKDTTK
jgi:hypothetical protein